MKAASHWRRVLIDKCLELLPHVEQQLIRSEKSASTDISRDKDAEMPERLDLSENPFSTNVSLVLNHEKVDEPQGQSNSEDPAGASLLRTCLPVTTSNALFNSLSSTSQRFSQRLPDLQCPNRLKCNLPYTILVSGGRDVFTTTPFRSISRQPTKKDVDEDALTMFKGPKSDSPKTTYGRRVHSVSDGLPRNGVPSLDLMDFSWRVDYQY